MMEFRNGIPWTAIHNSEFAPACREVLRVFGTNLADEARAFDIAQGRDLVGDAEHEVRRELLDARARVRDETLDGFRRQKIRAGDSIQQNKVAESIANLLQRDVALRDYRDGFIAVESAVARIRQQLSAIAVPVWIGLLVGTMQDLVPADIFRQHERLEDGRRAQRLIV